jgi:ABC-type bacteriocin/lantibiotic exporter with double-glycine peptidase domain
MGLTFGACASYRGAARSFEPNRLAAPGWAATPAVPVMRQTRELDCGPVATAMLLGYWGQKAEPDDLRAEAGIGPDRGLPAGTIRALFKARGFSAFLVEGELADLERELEAGRPVLVGLAKPFSDKQARGHYEIVAGLNRQKGLVVTVDPGEGWREYPLDGFMAEWQPTKKLTLVVSPPAASATVRLR